MAYHEPVTTSTRPRLVILKGAVTLDAPQFEALRSVFEVIEVHTLQAARKMLEGSAGGVVLCGPGEYLVIGGEPSSTLAGSILERIGEGIGVVDVHGTVLWTDARFKVYDDHVRQQFVRLCREAIEAFNQPLDDRNAGTRRQSKRYNFVSGPSNYELVVSPTSLDQNNDRVMSVVGVLWDVTASQALRQKLDAIDSAGADLLRVDPATEAGTTMADRLKTLEQKIVKTVREILQFDNFEVRLLDRETGQLELVIAVNISPLKIGESIFARPQGNGISGYVAATGQSYICPNTQADPLYREGMDNAASALTVPLMLQDKIIGTFNIESNRVNAFDENDRRFAEIYGRYIAAAMNVLDLLVIERYTTNQQAASNIVSELAGPMDELSQHARAIEQSTAGNDALRNEAAALLKTIATLRRRIETCTTGPRTILGAEQEMHRSEPDPLLVSKRILVADDEPAIRDTLSALLKQKGAQVTVCETGAETIDALEAARSQGFSYDLVLSDIKMPDRNGYEVYRTAKAMNPNTPVILMTGFGYDPHHCIVRASQEGLQSFLFKPFKASQLMEVLKRTLAAKA